MPAENIELVAVYEFNPSSPGNPNRNYWNEQTGEVIIDDFNAGNLNSAVYEKTNGNYDAVQMITVAGPVSQYDWGVVNNYNNCTFLDMSRTYGVTYVPSWNFYGNTSLTSIALPASIESIEYYAFQNCSSLSSISIYAMTPPTIGYDAFYGIGDSIVYVPAASLPLYQEAEGWKDFTILPLANQVSALEVNLPNGTDVNVYKDMYIELINTQSGQKQRYVITNRLTYTFNSLIKRTNYNVYLKNSQGDVLGEVDNVDVGDQDVSITFSELKVPRELLLQVTTPEGQDVTEQTTITWMDQKGTFLTKGNKLAGQMEGAKAMFHITLPQTLAMQYELPTDSLYVVETDNNISYVLAALPQMTISGVVRDIKTSRGIAGATIAVSQTLNGLYSKAFTTKADTKGQWSLTVFDAPTDITASMTDYVSKSQSFEKLVTEVPDFELKDINGTTVSINLTYTSTAGETQDYYDDYANVAYTVVDATTQHEVTGFNVQYPQIVLQNQSSEGTQYIVTATSKNGKFMPVSATATVDDLDCASVTLPIKQLGGITAKFNQTDNTSVVGILYDSNGRLVKRYNYGNATLNISELNDGDYTLVTMGNSQFFNGIGSVSQFTESGLKAGTDYVKNAVTVKSGEITTISNSLIPYLDETKLYYTGDNTSIAVNKSQITVGNYLTLSGRVDFKSAYAGSISDVKLIVDLPEESSFVDNSVMAGNRTASYTYADHRLVVPLASVNDRIRFCFIPTAGGNYSPVASVQFILNGKEVTQPIGSVDYMAKDLSINVPSLVAKTAVPVSGTAVGKSTVEIYDNGVLIGQTTSLANGSWATTVELKDPYNLSVHSLYAKLTTSTGVQMQTETQQLTYDANAIQLSKVIMYHNNPEMNKVYDVVFDYLNPNPKSQKYTYYIYNREFTFTIDFTSNDTTKIKNVKLYVLTGRNNIFSLTPVYDKKQGLWVVSGEFGNMYDGDIPVNVSVDYDVISDTPVDDTPAQISQLENLEFIDEIIDTILDEYLVGEVITDEEDYMSMDVTMPELLDAKFNVTLRAFDYSRCDSLRSLYTFIEAEVDTLSYAVFDEIIGNGYHMVVIDNGRQFIYEMSITSYASNLNPVALRHAPAIANGAWSNLLRAIKTMDGTFLKDIGGGILDAFDIAKYLEVPAFRGWVDMLDNYIASGSKWEVLVENALNKRCKGQLRLTTAQYNTLRLELTKINLDAAMFYQGYVNYLDLYRSRLLNAILYDLSIGIISNRVGAIAKLGSKAGRILTNSKNAKYFQSFFRFGKNQTLNRTRLGNAFELIADATCNQLGNLINPEWADFQQISREKFGQWAPKVHADLMGRYAQLITKTRSMYSACKDEPDTIKTYPPFIHTPADPSIDPSGYVYEGVTSNRLEGVTATAYYKELVEDMYGDLHENIVLWDAEEYAQENPLFTDENGMYRWDVPQGLWQVKFEKEGYQTTYSEWLPVPPPQLEVNIPMTQMLQPTVKNAKAYDKGVEFEFDKFMDSSTLTADNIMVTKNGNTVTCDIELLNEEAADEDEEQTYASKVRLNVPENEELLSTDEIQLTIKKIVKSYAGMQMQDDYSQTFDVEPIVRSIAVDALFNVGYGEQRTITVAALPVDAAKGKNIFVKSLSEMIATIDTDMLTLDENGQAELVISGELPGSTVLNFMVENTDVTGMTTVNVKEAEMLITETPKASRISGTEVYSGTMIRLTSDTENAVIYYTLDGSCPCETATALVYNPDEPIVITGDVTIKAMAQGHDLADSEVVEFSYSLKKSTVGYNLQEGWNWISHNLESAVDVSEFKTNAERILSQTSEVVKDPSVGMIGTLTELQPTEAYKVKVSAATEKRLNGLEFNVTANAIPVTKGWNWISYPVSQVMTVDEALAFHDATVGDYIVGQNGYAEYTNDGWKGSLTGLEPGKGYLYKSAVSDGILFNSTIVSNAVSSVNKRNYLIGSPWAPNKYAYPNIMPMTAELFEDGVRMDGSKYVIGAFAESECRGVGIWQDGRLLMTIYGEGGEDIRFIAAEKGSDYLYDITEIVSFAADNVGTWNAPYTLTLGGEVNKIDEVYSDFALTPDVANDHLTINLAGKEISRLTLTALNGQNMLSLKNVGKGATITTNSLPTGVYILSVQAEGQSYYKKIRITH